MENQQIFCNKCNTLVEKEHDIQHNTDCKEHLIDSINKILEKTDNFTLRHILNYISNL